MNTVEQAAPPSLTAIYKMLMNLSGSGAQAVPVRQTDMVAGSGTTPIVTSPEVEVAIACSAQIAYIKSAFGLSISQLAGAFQVQRPTIYAWMADTAEPRDSNKTRIDQIYHYAKRWAEQCHKPALRLSSSATIDGHDLVWHLEQPNIDGEAIERLFEVLLRTASQETDGRNGKGALVADLRARGFAEAPQSRSGSTRR